jgi:predicted nucleic acid-binding protein
MKIFDASSVICILQDIRSPKILEICKKNGYSIAISSIVFDEIKKNRKTFEIFKKYNSFEILNDFDQSEYERMLNRYPGLHEGEISVICCALRRMRNGDRHYCIIDETAARNVVQSDGSCRGLKLTGTVGLILWEKNKTDLSKLECKDIYESFTKSGFWIKKSILEELLK